MNLKSFIFFCLLSLLLPGVCRSADNVFTPAVSISTEYDDNILFSRTAQMDDMILLITPEMELNSKTERFSLNGRGHMEISRYMDNPALNNENYSIDLSGGYIPEERMQVNARVSRVRDTTLDTELAETGILTRRQKRNRSSAALNFSYDPGEQDNVAINTDFDTVDYDSPDRMDYRDSSVSLTYTRLTMDRINGIILQPYFSGTSSAVNRVNSLGFYAGLSRSMNETWNMRALLGARRTKIRLFSVEDREWGWLADISLKKTGRTWDLGIGFTHDLYYSSTADSIERDRLQVGYSKNISESIRAALKGSVTMARSAGPFSGQDSKYFSLNPSLRYRIADNWSLNMSYTYSYNRSRTASATQGADRNVLRFSVYYSFPERF